MTDLIKMKFKSILFDNLQPGDKFKRIPYAGNEVKTFVKTEESVSIQEGGIYNAISITGKNIKKQINPQTHVYKIQRSS